MAYDFKDKTAIVTGGSEGVGAATARRLAEHGANLVLVARSKKNLERIAEELRVKTGVLTVPMDVSDTDACMNLFKKAEYEFGGIDILINNAGYNERGSVESATIDGLGAMVDVNLKAPILLSKLAIKYLKEAGGGAIINVASLAGRTPLPGVATYSATKFGLRAFTFALADELRGSNIKLAAVSPGPIDTGFIMSDIDDVTDLTLSQPMSTADEVAEEILKLVSNNKRERSMPPISGLLTTVSYLFPALSRLLTPLFIRKGRDVKRKLKARMRQQEEESGA